MRSQTYWCAALAVVLFALTGACPPARGAADVGQPAPALVAPELDGQSFDLSALHGKIVVVSFWATWCPPCRAEMPVLDAFYRQHHEQGLEMIGLSADRPHDRSEVVKVMQSFSYPAAMLDDAKTNDFGTPSALPVTFVIDGDGIVRAKLTPDEKPLTEANLGDAVRSLIAVNPGPPPSPVQDSTASH